MKNARLTRLKAVSDADFRRFMHFPEERGLPSVIFFGFWKIFCFDRKEDVGLGRGKSKMGKAA